jgi:hypothetical protein
MQSGQMQSGQMQQGCGNAATADTFAARPRGVKRPPTANCGQAKRLNLILFFDLSAHPNAAPARADRGEYAHQAIATIVEAIGAVIVRIISKAVAETAETPSTESAVKAAKASTVKASAMETAPVKTAVSAATVSTATVSAAGRGIARGRHHRDSRGGNACNH